MSAAGWQPRYGRPACRPCIQLNGAPPSSFILESRVDELSGFSEGLKENGKLKIHVTLEVVIVVEQRF